MENIQICGVDISSPATILAQKNLRHNIRLKHLKPIAEEHIEFVQDNILEDSDKSWLQSSWEVVVSNPPYISPKSFNSTTSRSVRNYEPKLALVPPQSEAATSNPAADNAVGDAFYPRLLHIAHKVNACVVLMEVADMKQATRVVRMVIESSCWSGCEIWRDWPSTGATSALHVLGKEINVRGDGNGRAVLLWGKDGCGLIT